MSKFSGIGLSIGIFEPLLRGRGYIGELREQINTYTHVIAALGGYLTATIDLAGSINELEEWLSLGLGRHVEVYNEAHQVIFEGFANAIQYNAGGVTITRGPLTEVANRVTVEYTPYDPNAKSRGAKTLTPAANDARSQALYGIWPAVVNGGEITPDEALQLRDTYLAEERYPRTSQTLDVMGVGQPKLTLTVTGYGAWSEHYTYANAAGTGTVNLSAKLIAILAASPNPIYSTDTSQITANTLQVPAATDTSSNEDGWAAIRELVALGDVNDTRYTFGWYAGRRAVYAPVPAAVEYLYRLSGKSGEIETMTGGRILPWNALPGRWLFCADLLVGRSQTGLAIRDDPRNMFIESLTYTAPAGLAFTGGPVATLAQKIARLGLGGR